MKAAVIEAPRRATIAEIAPPEAAAGEVVIRVDGCGVCGSNLPLWEGQPWFTYPLPAGAPGHEGWGTIVGVGDGVRHVRPGTRVAALSQRAYAEYDVAPADAVVPLPAALGDGPFPGEALACAVNVVRRAGVRPGERVAIVGIGFLGALVTGLLAFDRARITAVSRRPFALEVAAAQGADGLVQLRDTAATVAEAAALADGRGYPVVIEAAGTQHALDIASALVAERGRLVVAGYHQDGPRTVDMQSWNWRGLDVVNAHERDPRVYVRALRRAVAAVAAGDWNPAALVTHTFPLVELDRAFALMEERPAGFLKAVVRP